MSNAQQSRDTALMQAAIATGIAHTYELDSILYRPRHHNDAIETFVIVMNAKQCFADAIGFASR